MIPHCKISSLLYKNKSPPCWSILKVLSNVHCWPTSHACVCSLGGKSPMIFSWVTWLRTWMTRIGCYVGKYIWMGTQVFFCLRCTTISAFFESIKGVGTCVGARSLEEYILPLMVQALTGKEGGRGDYGYPSAHNIDLQMRKNSWWRRYSIHMRAWQNWIYFQRWNYGSLLALLPPWYAIQAYGFDMVRRVYRGQWDIHSYMKIRCCWLYCIGIQAFARNGYLVHYIPTFDPFPQGGHIEHQWRGADGKCKDAGKFLWNSAMGKS